MSHTIKLYRHKLSGHSHRVQLLASVLGRPVALIDVDLMAGAHKQPEFLAKNPLGQVPVIEDGDLTLADSNAILVYLASRYDEARTLYPTDVTKQAQVQRWLSIAAGELTSGPANARLVTVFGAGLDHGRAKSIAKGLFDVLEQELSTRAFLVGDDVTIADVAIYSYAAHAPEGGVSLDAYPNIRAWLGRIEALDGFVGMKKTYVAAAA